MLRGGAIVNVEGATLSGFEFYIGPTDRFAAAQRPRGRSSNEIPLPDPMCYSLCVISSIAWISLQHWIANKDARTKR